MIKFIKTKDPNNKHSITNIVFELEEELTLPEVLASFEDFLRACSYSFDGHVAIVDEDAE